MDAEQLILTFPSQTSFDQASFMVTSRNQEAFKWVESTSQWGNYGLILAGPSGCGKTHLAQIWQKNTNAYFIDLGKDNLENLSDIFDKNKHFIIENIEEFHEHQESLFHILNKVKEAEGKLLLTTQHQPTFDIFNLKDVLSRLKALPLVEISEPDDELFQAIMRKRFSDFQIQVDDRIINYVLLRAERSFSKLHYLIDHVYQISLSTHHKPTYSLVRDLLG